MAAVDPRDDPASVVAAQRVLLELWTILAGFADAMTIVGGSAPPLLTGDQPDDPYVGTLDVDLVIDPIGVPDDAYRTIAELLRERGYTQLDQPFRWLRSVAVEGRSIAVEVDLLAPVTPRGGAGHRHERIGGEPLARRTEGAELVRTAFVDQRSEGLGIRGRGLRRRCQAGGRWKDLAREQSDGRHNREYSPVAHHTSPRFSVETVARSMVEPVTGHQTVGAETELVVGPDVHAARVVRGAESRCLGQAQPVFGDDRRPVVTAAGAQAVAAGHELVEMHVPGRRLRPGEEEAAVPQAPACVEGVINLRGRIIPVVDLRGRFGLPAAAAGAASRIVVCDASGDRVGLVVDGVSEVLMVPADAVEPTPGIAVGSEVDYVRGVARLGEQMIILLDLEHLFSVAETGSIAASA